MNVPRNTPQHAAQVRSSVAISAIGQYPNWSREECAVDPENAQYWRTEVAKYTGKGPLHIPKHIHQIWIGTREPPCVWLDTWRIDFMADASKEWSYTLWDNDKAASFSDMVNRDLFEEEKMWQCKADIMRLEILYKYGGVYIDADMISLGKPIDDVVDSCRETGFLMGYEPDTKDKPYSVLGNSFIVASKGHPLVRLLIGYIYAIYHHKRPYHSVEWVTGPLACTKALVHTNMPFTVPKQELFYPQFHYVPNPSAVDFSAFPKARAFQFGLTCSGLTEWVEANNRCKRAQECPHHAKRTDYPLGAILPFPSVSRSIPSHDPNIPKVIHQFQLHSSKPPKRWMKSWTDAFIEDHADWQHKVWTYDSLKSAGGFFFANLYPKEDCQLELRTMLLLALEVLYKQGGYYVPLSTLYGCDEGSSGCDYVHTFPPNATGDLSVCGSIIGCPQKSLNLLAVLKAAYDTGRTVLPSPSRGYENVVEQGFSDVSVLNTGFPEGSRFLGASEIFFSQKTHAPRGVAGANHSAMVFGYDCQVPCTLIPGDCLESIRLSKHRSVFVFDAQMALYPPMLDAIPGFIHKASEAGAQWDIILVGMQWCAHANEEVLYKATGPFRDDHVVYLAAIVNAGSACFLPASFKSPNDLTEAILGMFDKKTIYVGVRRFADTEEVSAVYRAMPIVSSAFEQICGHPVPGWHRDETEIHGRLLKGMRGGQIAFEISVDEEQRIMYRAFNPDGGLNCEIKINMGTGGRYLVDHARVFYDHTIVFEGSQIAL